MYFLSLIVENLRCFGEAQNLDLSDEKEKPARWTVILGDNGTGKTTLLKCLVGSEPILQHTDKGAFWYPKAHFLLDYEGESRTLLHNFSFKRYAVVTPFGVTAQFYRGTFDSHVDSSVAMYAFTHREAYGQPEEYLTETIIYAYGASRRMGRGAFALSDTKNSDPSASLFFDDVSLINAEEWLLQAYFAAQNAKQDERTYFENRYEKIKMTLIRLLEDVRDVRVRTITKSQPNPAIEVETPYGWVEMSALSLGYQSLIAWVVDLASRLFDRYPDSENPLEEPAIVLVDEIDLHLHPKWQRAIIQYLTELFKNTQFIVTAHSPLIVQAATDANVVLLKREGDHVVIHNKKDLDIIQGWRLDQVLTSDLFGLESARPPEYDAFLKRQREILEQPTLSPADEQELERLASKLDELQPVFERQEDRGVMEILRKAADILKPELARA